MPEYVRNLLPPAGIPSKGLKLRTAILLLKMGCQDCDYSSSPLINQSTTPSTTIKHVDIYYEDRVFSHTMRLPINTILTHVALRDICFWIHVESLMRITVFQTGHRTISRRMPFCLQFLILIRRLTYVSASIFADHSIGLLVQSVWARLQMSHLFQ